MEASITRSGEYGWGLRSLNLELDTTQRIDESNIAKASIVKIGVGNFVLKSGYTGVENKYIKVYNALGQPVSSFESRSPNVPFSIPAPGAYILCNSVAVMRAD
ncbi:hypothetical protein [Viscerimonas tarda]